MRKSQKIAAMETTVGLPKLRARSQGYCGLSSKEEDYEIPMKTLEDILTRHPFLNDLPPQHLPLLLEFASIEEFGPASRFSKKAMMRSIFI